MPKSWNPPWNRLARLLAAALSLAALAAGSGCDHNGEPLEVVSETDEKQYQYAQQMLKEGRQAEALAAFLRVIQKRQDDAPESQIEAGQLCLSVKKDPIEAIYHFQKYLEAKPNSDQAPMVKEMIDTAKKEFARSLPGQPYHGEYDRLDLLEQIKTLQAQVDDLHRQLGTVQSGSAARASGISLDTVKPTPSDNIAATPLNPNGAAASTSTTPTTNGAPKPANPRTYTVEAGDTLSRISTKMYGSTARWQDIYKANGDQLKSPTALRAGQVLKIP